MHRIHSVTFFACEQHNPQLASIHQPLLTERAIDLPQGGAPQCEAALRGEPKEGGWRARGGVLKSAVKGVILGGMKISNVRGLFLGGESLDGRRGCQALHGHDTLIDSP
jgi:hypothetical protein